MRNNSTGIGSAAGSNKSKSKSNRRSNRITSIGSAAGRNYIADFMSPTIGMTDVGGAKGFGGKPRFYILPSPEDDDFFFYDSWTGKTFLRYINPHNISDRQMIDVYNFHETRKEIIFNNNAWLKSFYKPVFIRPLVVERKDFKITLASDDYHYEEYFLPYFDIQERRDFLEYFGLENNQQF